MLAVGRNIRTQEVAKIHDKVNDITSLTPMKIFLEPFGDVATGKEWPAGEHVIFDGLVTGIGYQRTNNKLNIVVSGIHWLANMAFSSALSSTSHPTNPFMVNHDATKELFTVAGAGSKDPTLLSSQLVYPKVTLERVQTDFWGSTLKVIFCAMAAQPPMKFFAKECIGSVPKDPKNKALEALARIEGDSLDAKDDELGCKFEAEDGSDASYAKPLSINIAGEDNGVIINSLVNAIGQQYTATWQGVTMWHKLQQYAAQYLFAIVPMAQRALVVPFTPSLREPWRVLELKDYTMTNQSLQLPRPIRSVSIYGGGTFSTLGTGSGNEDDPGFTGFGGCFVPEGFEDDAVGVDLVRQAPAWLKNAARMPSRAGQSTGVNDTAPNNLKGTRRSKKARGKKGEGTPKEVNEKLGPALARYAQAVYYQEVLRGRTGMLTGKLRFDVAPGSTIQVEGARKDFLQDQSSIEDTFFATVTNVTIGLNATTSQAGTGFQLAYIRNQKENESENFSTKIHPIYEQTWKGAPLVPGLDPEDEG
jgi:hypothetical protein